MKITLFFFCLLVIHVAHSELKECFNEKEECHSTNYQSYVECVRSRQKRSIDCGSSCSSNNCIDTCNDCDCSSCNYSNCHNSCNNCCSTCCSNYIPCHTNHCCHKTCHAQCSTSSCRSSCRRNCFETVRGKTEEKVVAEREQIYIEGSKAATSNITNFNRHNITTIIHLNNVINNTNLIDVPIVLNNTNTQNITLYNEESHDGIKTTEKCCTVISPRQCTSTPKPRCFHYRSKQCGPFCTASIVHKEQQQVCQSYYPGAPPKCSQQIIYIPQPQPKCSYQSVWPYVSCGIQKQETCQGCYSHYTDPQSTNYLTCPPQCYDDGFGIGSMYRQGPVYRPWYSHQPCYDCLGYQNPFGGAYPGGYPAMGLGGYPPVSYAGGYPQYFQQDSNDGTIPVLNLGVPNPVAGKMNNVVVETDPLNVLPQDQGLDRLSRDVEIEVKYEPSTKAQAEVKIQKEDVIPVEIIDGVGINNTKVEEKLP